jgi:serine/threonine-protein kinase
VHRLVNDPSVIGALAGSYRITDVLSVGGMGTVYRAEHTLIGRIAAVKVLHPEMSASKDIVQRFFNEAKATTSIKHPGIVEIYDYGHLESGHAYLVMEFLDGRTLSARNKQRGRIPEGEAAALLRGVCGALAAAHAKGIVHRDLKPDNIFLVPDPDSLLGERAKLLDFGIAKLTDIGLASSATKTGAVMGTPTYMSPEQCRGTGDVDHRADLYSLGCMFYEMVAGRPPFVDRGAGELIGAHLFMQPEPPTKVGATNLSAEAEQLIMSLLSKQAADRPQSANDLNNLLVALAVRGGFGSAANWERASMPIVPRPSSAGFDPSTAPTQFTPSHNPPAHYTPSHHTPSHHTPAPHAGGYAMTQPQSSPAMPLPAPLPTPMFTPGMAGMQTPLPHTPMPQGTGVTAEKPTTLSGAAGHTAGAAPRSGKRGLAFICAGIAVGSAIAVLIATRSTKHETSPAAQPAPTETRTMPVATTPAETKPAETTSAPTTPVEPKQAATTPVETKPVETKPVETKPVETKPVETKPVETKPVETKPVETKPVETKPVETKQAATKPAEKKSTTATQTKPRTPKPRSPKKPSSDPLLETDL